MTDNHNIWIPPTRYEIWGWPAVANLTLGGTACGYFLFSLINTELFLQTKATFPLFRYNIISPFLVALGFLTVAIEAGRPRRGIFLLHHLKRSWMSREVLVGMLFIIFAALDALQPNEAFRIIAAFTATGLMLSQGFMVFRAKAVIAWNSYMVPCYFISSGLVLGFGFLLLWSTIVGQMAISAGILILGLSSLFINLVAWYIIVKPKPIATENQAVIHLRDTLSMTMTFGFGHLVPILLVSTMLILTFLDTFSQVTYMLSMIAGVCILAGGIAQKNAFVLQANALREVKSGRPNFQTPYCPGP